MDGDGPKQSSRAAAGGTAAAADAPNGEFDSDEIGDGPGGGLLSKLFGWARTPADQDETEMAENGAASARELSAARKEMIERVVAFDEKRVVDVMAPRADIIAVAVDAPLETVVRTFAEAGHSRMPIYRGDLDDPLGMVHIKDVVRLISGPQPAPPPEEAILMRLRRPVLYVPPSMRVTDLLLKMQASRIHMALVIDEYGGTDGLVTIEDLVEEIVGDINDEHDEDEAPVIVRRPGGGWEADARVELAEVSEATGAKFESDEDEEIDTLGGLVAALAGRVPQRGEVLSHPAGFDFEVIEADARKIRKIRIRPRQDAPEPAQPDAAI